MKKTACSVLLILCFTAVSTSCYENTSSGNIPREELTFIPEVESVESFVDLFYQPVDYTLEPDMAQIGLPIVEEEVINLEDVLLFAGGYTDTPVSILENGFIIVPSPRPTDNPVTAYEMMKSWEQPVYISAGIPLHLMHIFFDQLLQQVEEKYLREDLEHVCTVLYEKNLLRGHKLNAGYFAVALKLLNPRFEPDESVLGTVTAEIELIMAHQGFDESPVFGYREDYSQYVPRGHYTASITLERYFRSMMWLGRLTMILRGGEPHGPTDEFLVSEEDARNMTTAALLIVSDLCSLDYEGNKLQEIWQKIYETTAFFAGFADDLSVPDYLAAAEMLLGEHPVSNKIYEIEFYNDFLNLIAEEFAGPAIYSGTGQLISLPDEYGGFDPEDFAQALSKTTGFRFLGQRYAIDSEILGKLVFPSVGQNSAGNLRFMPSGLDVAAVFGSSTALEILEETGETGYQWYSDTLVSLGSRIGAMTESDWHESLYTSWLHALYLLQQERGEGYPDFMQTEAWGIHTLSNFLASWAMLRHDTILYIKQSYTMEAGCAPPPPKPSAGFVEPVPEVYAEIRAVLQMAQRGLSAYEMIDEPMTRQLASADELVRRLQNIAELELAGEEISEADSEFLKNFAEYLQGTIAWGQRTEEGTETSLIADVHTDQNTMKVLEVASGYLDCAIVVYRRPDGLIEAAIGPVLSYYEFTWPMNDRLTDEAWRDILHSPQPVVSRPTWIDPIFKSSQE